MSSLIILGIDPGIKNTGYGVIKVAENKLKESTIKIENLEGSQGDFRNKLEKEKEEVKENLQQKENEIENLKKELQKLTSDKYVEIESLKEEVTTKEDNIKALNQKITSLEETIAEAKGAPQLIESIKDIMISKGFLSDREFDSLLENKEI